MRVKLCFLFILISLSAYLNAQNQKPSFVNIPPEKGLSNGEVRSIAQDKNGYLWFGTTYGANRFDGYEFVQYLPSPFDTNTISGEEVYKIFLDKNDRLWFCTSKGLCRYQYEFDSFKQYQLYDGEDIPVVDIEIYNLIEDTNGNIYTITPNGHLFKYYCNNDRFVWEYSLENAKNIKAFVFDTSNQLWLATENQIFQYMAGHGFYHRLSIPAQQSAAKPEVSAMLFQGDILWIGCINGGLFNYNIQNSTFQHFFINHNNPMIFNILEGDGELWLSTGEGLFILNTKANSIISFKQTADQKTEESDHAVHFTYIDHQKNIWLGLGNKGIDVLYNTLAFNFIDIKTDLKRSGIPTALSIDEKGTIMIGYSEGGMDLYHPAKGHQHNYIYHPNNPYAISPMTVFNIYTDTKGREWVCTYKGGLKEFDAENNTFTSHQYVESKDLLFTNDIRSIAEDQDGNLWLAVHGFGLVRYNPDTGASLSVLKEENLENGTLPDDWPFVVLVDKQNNVWSGHPTGLSRRNEDGKFSIFNKAGESSRFITSDRVNDLFEDSLGRIWIGTSYGLNIYLPEKDSIIHILSKNGLPDNYISAICADQSGDIWVSTLNGIANIELTTFKIKSFNRNNGLNEFFFKNRAVTVSTEGYLYFGGNNGIIYFHPDSLKNNTKAPLIHLVGFFLNNNEIEIDNKHVANNPKTFVLPKHVNELDTLELSHKQNMFSIAYVGLNYIYSSKNQYAYILEGFDKEWNKAGDRMRAYYTNVPPGEYVFRVKAANSDGIWSEQEKKLLIIIHPPFWRTWWFALLVLLFCGGLLILIQYQSIEAYRRRQTELKRLIKIRTKELELANYELTVQKDDILRKNLLLIKQRKRIREIAQELHRNDQLKIRFFMNITHEFRTPLTLILGPLQKLLGTENDVKKIETLNILWRNANRLHRLINQLLDLRKLEVGALKLQTCQDNLADFVSIVFNSFTYLAKEKNIRYKLVMPENELLCFFDKDILDKILYNLLSNAFNYTENGKSIIVKLQIEKGSAQIDVIDTGIGIPENMQHFIFDRFRRVEDSSNINADGVGIGLALSRDLARLHKGELSVISEIGKGSTFRLSIPVSQSKLFIKVVDNSKLNDKSNEQYMMVNEGESITAQMHQNILARNIKVNRQKTSKIMIVDDNSDIRAFIAGELENDYEIIEAEDGQKAFDLATSQIPCIIISDVLMPNINGFELTRMLKSDQRTSHIQVILLTARSSESDQLSAFECGADDYIPKPFNNEALKLKIANSYERFISISEFLKRNLLARNTIFPENNVEEKFIVRVKEVVHKNFADPNFTIDILAQEMAMSRAVLYRKFQTVYNQSPNKYIQEVRLIHALEILKTDHHNIEELAAKVGFLTPNYFARLFKERFGFTPN